MLTQARLKEVLWYDPIVGVFIWKKRRGSTKIGDFCLCKDKKGYVVIKIDKKKYYAHRLVFLYEKGNFPNFDIDHENGNKSDNRFINLREASRAENRYNSHKSTMGLCPYKGVHYHKRAWQASIVYCGTKIYIGRYDNSEEAALAYDAAAREYFGKFARLNFPKEGEAGC